MKSTQESSTAESVKEKNIDEPRIIAVGASAGGLEALKAFFKKIPAGDNNAYVVIQHLSPDYKSMMGELLSKNTNLPIVQITDEMEVKSGHVYLIPPVNNLILEGDRLILTDKPNNQTLNLPIDMFFESMAKQRKEKSIGIVLSGTGSDGTRGVRAIKENDGMVMVQDPSEAKFDGMPKSAINTGLVDYILSVDEMGPELIEFISAPPIFHFKDGDVQYDEKELNKILNYIDKQAGLDFREYKYATLARRVARRVNICKCKNLKEYYEYLTSNEEEVEILYREFLIGVTKFFRDDKVWERLRNDVFPELIEGVSDGGTLKIWDVACSTGEEAYSFAMCIHEEMEKQGKNLEIKIFATDISQPHLDIGSKGIYPESIVADVSKEFLLKYFLSKSNGYQVSEKIRRTVIFSRHNIIKNPPFSNMDMVVCRNLLIYFQNSIQKKAMNMLHYALKEDGILVLGTSESVHSHKENFAEIDRKWKIYRNIQPSTRIKNGISHASANDSMNAGLLENKTDRDRKKFRTQASNPIKQKLQSELNETILEQFGGASVFVDSDYNILQAVGEFRKYANLPLSGFSINLLDMLDQDLKYIVQSTFNKAYKEQKRVVYRDILIESKDGDIGADIVIKPFTDHSLEGETNYVITFIEKELNFEKVEQVAKISPSNQTKEYVTSLENELKSTKEELQTSLEEIETSNEELQAANEELLASNEELQSTNEELQSVNEEINTVNAENIQKMDDLAALNADMNNLLKSTEIGVIFLDSSLKIRKFTPAIKKHFSLINGDIGRPIDNFTNSFGLTRKQSFLDRCHKVLDTGKILEKHIVSREGKNYLQRISPYMDSNNEIDGVVISFIDIENIQKSKEKLIASEQRFKSFYEDDPVLHISVDPKNSRIVQCNRKAVQKLGFDSKEDLIGKAIHELFDKNSQLTAMKLKSSIKKTGELVNLEQNMITNKGKILPVILNATAEKDENDELITIRYTCVDISALKKAEVQLKEQKNDLERANRDLEQFVSICSHDLQEPLATIKFGSDVLGKMYASKLDEKGENYIKYIKNASDRLSAQIRALLEHSRIGKNGQKTLVDTKEVVEVVKYDLGKSIRDANAKVHTGALPELKGYEVELRLLFQNLISNAIKYVPKDRDPEIRISAYKENEFWVFSIMDNGVGISKEDQRNIFTIFNRVPGNEDMQGTGVGLAHVEKIVLLHEGSIWVDSQEGVGSTFYFKLKAE
ncbi:CheR family methyltransferase [Christiangramia echinicola]|uniref:Two-component system, chemotaxis family, CheB/CheR fusion protein n=1 Tax=Christiangramia echinicola TaxID=279359 RepID=A0A1H1QTD7_9FLAO|nr:CheR family methyltransferase [Christiangramia echinicola]SDS26627.1 two-component system, chemotaxis family, CheB/CheR fusion protein [Christiangramia echinicola]